MVQGPETGSGNARGGKLAFVVTLGALAAVSATTVDVCIPAQPEIARAYGAAPAAGAALVSAYLLGYGPGQLIWGPLADRFGRRPPLFLSLAGFILASVVCALAGSFEVLLLARGAQGLLGAASPVIARAIARDQGGGAASASLISAMTIVLGGAPLLAPAIGSGLLVLFEWPAIFWFLALFGLLTALSAYLVLAESLPPANRRSLSPAGRLRDARRLFAARDFRVGIGVSASIFAGYAALLSIGAAVALERYAVPAEAFGPLFTLAAVAFVVGSVAARQWVRRFGIHAVLTLGAGIAGLAGLGLALAAGAVLALPVFWGLVGLYVLAFGLLLPASTALALEPAGEMAGFGSSLIGALQVLAGALGAQLAAAGIWPSSYAALCWVMAAAAGLCLGVRIVSLVVKRA
ncbi:MAG: MFS transporter [Kiloniellales bacterium]|nr:MFS transporter [Kiloniellales bacterium]